MPPIHPGETLREDFLEPLGLTANRLAMAILLPMTRVNDIVSGQTGDYGRHRTPPVALFWNDASVLDEPSGQLRPRTGGGCPGS